MKKLRTILFCMTMLPALALMSGCTGGTGDLEQYIGEVKARPGGRIEPLPEINPYETFTYRADAMRSPFAADTPTVAITSNNGIRPDDNRNREYLEQFPLDTLRMVGTMESGNRYFALIQDGDGLIHRVLTGNYVGQNDGRIVTVTPSSIELVEIVSDGLGGYIERPAAVALQE